MKAFEIIKVNRPPYDAIHREFLWYRVDLYPQIPYQPAEYFSSYWQAFFSGWSFILTGQWW